MAKVRGIADGTLPPEYAARFCDHDSVDEHFLEFFNLKKDDFAAAVHRLGSDEAIALWFGACPGVNDVRIAGWNALAENLGRAGFPMEKRLRDVLPAMYAHLDPGSAHSIFDLLEVDEQPKGERPPQ